MKLCEKLTKHWFVNCSQRQCAHKEFAKAYLYSVECSNGYIGVEQDDRVDEFVDILNESVVECQNGDELRVVDASKCMKSAEWWNDYASVVESLATAGQFDNMKSVEVAAQKK